MATRAWTAGHILCVSAGAAMIVSAFLPWAAIEGTRASYGAVRLGLYQPLAAVLVIGGALVAFGVSRSMWAALAAMGAGLASALLIVIIHADLYAGLARIGAPVQADAGHLSGFGVSALFAAGLMCGLAGVVTAIQSAPAVRK